MERNKNIAKSVQPLIILACLLLLFFATGLIEPGNAVAGGIRAAAPADGYPIGAIVAWSGESDTIPDDWMLCNGKQLKIKKYKDLHAAIGAAWGGSATRFNLPDLRGRTIRGADGGSGRDPDANKRQASKSGGNKTGVGSVQGDSFQGHAHDNDKHGHNFSKTWADGGIAFFGGFVYISTGLEFSDPSSQARSDVLGPIKYGTTSNASHGDESRPKNAAVLWIIKVK